METAWCFAMAEQVLADLAGRRPLVGVAMKWVPLRTLVDPLTGAVSVDDRLAGASPADRAALEIALRYAERVGADVVVVCVGPLAAETMLRSAVACGAHRAVRVDPGQYEQQPNTTDVARALAAVFEELSGHSPERLLLVCCGDWSLDRGSASVPPLLAHFLGVPHALGLVAVRFVPAVDNPLADNPLADNPVADNPWLVECERRLDGGRREILRVTGPAVVSLEGAVAALRRASLGGVLAAHDSMIEVLYRSMDASQAGVTLERVSAHRPMPRPVASISADNPGHRVSLVLGVGTERRPPMRVTLDPDAAASLIVEQLILWGQPRG